MPEFPAVPRATTLISVEQALADNGPLAQTIEFFEPREGQREMAQAVAQVLAEGGTLLAEAGTGTGKTLAYLVPAILSGRRVLVSTGTKNLQEQIYFKDLPMLARALPVRFTATYMKGRANYLCLHRLDQARASGPDGLFDSIAAWASETDTGDRAELEDLPDDSGLWTEVAATAETCLGSTCPQHEACFVTRMRQRASAADVVIVNHHLLCADAAVRQSSYGEVIPECRHLVLDEAHQIEDVATQYFGVSVSTYRLDGLVRDCERFLNLGRTEDSDGDLRRAVGRVADHARQFFHGLAMARRDYGRTGDERLRLQPDGLGDSATDAAALTTALDGLEAHMGLSREGTSDGPDDTDDRLALARRAGELSTEVRFLIAAADPAFVYFLEFRGRAVFLRAAPINVADIVREHIFDRMHATVLTSATLAVDRSFDYVRRRLGIAEAVELRGPSEFDYASQSLLYLPRRMPSPRAFGFADAVAREACALVERSQGRAFLLFTSYAMLRAVHERVVGQIPYPLLVQGTAPRSALLNAFRATPHAVLLATSSFWQGVDVAGEQLSCVVIDKLPFASPGDPITAARIEAIGAEGGNPFDDYQVPLAVLALLQGLGRLIRHRRDRGVLAVLDPRLRTMGYGRRFLDSLPPARLTQDLGEVERFFRL
ncbi:MAG: ATP-dependent DNA helicase [Acidobacteriota bacterium]